MEWVIVFLVLVAIIILAAILYQLQVMNNNQYESNKRITALYGEIRDVYAEVYKKGSVTPPIIAANKTHTVGASSKHIIIRKTPDQIRNENFEKIKNGATYGQPE